jgi:hypothetical protein
LTVDAPHGDLFDREKKLKCCVSPQGGGEPQGELVRVEHLQSTAHVSITLPGSRLLDGFYWQMIYGSKFILKMASISDEQRVKSSL